MLDLSLAITHHLLIFGLFGVLAIELINVRRGMTTDSIVQIGRVDLWYGILAGLIVVVGFLRAVYAAKGWGYYSHNAFFWAKIATFAVIGVLSVPPTITYIRWRRAGSAPTDDQIAGVRRYLWAETLLFALLPAFAAAMARGYGAI